jgi:hypothetical protein
MGRGLLKQLRHQRERVMDKSIIYEEKRHPLKRRSDQSYGNCLLFRQPDSMNQILKSGVGPHVVIRRIHL